jgi:hypothetical protein
MSDDVRQVTTEEGRERLHAARNRGGICAGCGRPLTDDETVYIERFVVDTRKLLVERTLQAGGSAAQAPVGIECASPELLQEMEGQPPERCAGGGRRVVYRTASSKRHRALCSRRCVSRTAVARRSGEQA